MAGIYIHIPFCKQKCTYCDFHFSTNFHSYYDQMISCMLDELKLRKNEIKNEIIETIYFGGGTPSLLKTESLVQILKIIKSFYDVSIHCECTLECNPDDITFEKLLECKKNGINRLSIGIQSFDNSDLKWMNRAHTAKQGIESIKLAQKIGLENISIDLIYGQPKMDNIHWEKQIDTALSLNIQHISAYCLTIENKTVLNHLVQTKKIIPATNEVQSDQFVLLQEKLEKNDFIQYEISNFGLKNYFSKHNSSYWKNINYIGIGPSAHSFIENKRSWNISNNTIYMNKLKRKELPSEFEILSSKDQFNEFILKGLRTIWGVSLLELENLFPLSIEFLLSKDKYIKEGKMLEKNNTIYLTKKGFLIADSIAVELFI
jgi:oxygen-independent coproporphyrinogen-3 oxidase